MSKNITIAGASYADVPAITVPSTAGGTAKFVDVSDTTATAADVATGKQFYGADGGLVIGTASGGGGSGGAGDCLTMGGAVLDDSAFTGTGKTLYDIPDTIEKIESSAITAIAAYAGERKSPFRDKLTSLILNNVTEIGDSGLARRSLLANCLMPLLTKIGRNAFYDCNKLIPTMPSLAETGEYAFQYCFSKGPAGIYQFDNLASPGKHTFDHAFKSGDTLKLPALKYLVSSLVYSSEVSLVDIGSTVETAVAGSLSLDNPNANVILRTPTPPVWVNTSTVGDLIRFNGYQATGHIYVPDDAVEAYKTAPGWSRTADRFLPLSAFPG